MKNEEFFKGVFQKASAAHPVGEKNREYNIVFEACMDCIRAGEHDQGYVRNQLGYNNQLPSTVVKEKKNGKDIFFLKSELFGRIWNSAIAQVRLLVANATANEVWGFAFLGMRGANGIITPYVTTIEKDSDSVQFLASKDDAIAFIAANVNPSKVSKTGQMTFELTIPKYLSFLAQKFPGKDVDKKHEAFAAKFREKLSKYAAFRSERMSMPTTDLAAKYNEW